MWIESADMTPKEGAESDLIHETKNSSRFCVETRQVAWVLLLGVLVWGVYAYFAMPQRKDPDVPVRKAVVVTPWIGAGAERIEQLVTRRIEEALGTNPRVMRVESDSRANVSVVHVELDEAVRETGKEFDDLQLKLNGLRDLPEGAGPPQFIKDFGDTAALMLTIASPPAGSAEVGIRSRDVRRAILRARARRSRPGQVSLVFCFPPAIQHALLERPLGMFAEALAREGRMREVRILRGPGFVGVHGVSAWEDAELLRFAGRWMRERLQTAELHPDSWPPVAVRNPEETEARLAAIAGDRYGHRELSGFADLIERTLKAVPQVSRVARYGELEEQITLYYSQERLASQGLQPAELPQLLEARNTSLPGGILAAGGRNIALDLSGRFTSVKEIGDVVVGGTSHGSPLYLRDFAEVVRGYETPARYLNYYRYRDADGRWRRARALTLAIQMRAGEKIGEFGREIDVRLEELKRRLPEDLILARTSDQPLQVTENVDLFMKTLYEAVALVVLVSLIGFWEWRSALLMALSIPITLAMTFGLMHLLGIDLQQVSIASLIIALGLLVDDPVVAGDAIQRELGRGHPRAVAAWLGPSKLASAILYATVTNIIAYLPILALTGDTGRFLYSLPVVITCSLVASRVVSMTIIPLLGYYLLRPGRGDDASRVQAGRFAGVYRHIVGWAIDRRWAVVAASLLPLVLGGFCWTGLRTQFFPKDLSYLSYLDVWLPEGSTVSSTNEAAFRAELAVQEAAAAYGRKHPGEGGKPRPVLRSLTTFVGGGGPRFWFSVEPELHQLNYAQILVQVEDKHDTHALLDAMQVAVDRAVPGARVDVRYLESGKPVGVPVQVRLTGDNPDTLRALGAQVEEVFRSLPATARVRNDWGNENLRLKLAIDSDRANLAGVTHQDVAVATGGGTLGIPVARFQAGDRQVPVVARLQVEERARIGDIPNLYVASSRGPEKVQLRQIASLDYGMELQRIRRRDQFRTLRVLCFPASGFLPSQVFEKARPRLQALAASLPPGYRLEIGGEDEEQQRGFLELALVLALSSAAIYLALVFQFRDAFKPLIVFAAIPFGMVGALGALLLAGAPFGFMAFLGIVSLVGVIVSHIIVLFDFIEECRARGEPLREALVNAGIMRLRPVLITVGATVIALFPLATHGGPLWEPLCYAQIGGLTVATFVTLILVPVLYAIFVQDLRWVRWAPETQVCGKDR